MLDRGRVDGAYGRLYLLVEATLPGHLRPAISVGTTSRVVAELPCNLVSEPVEGYGLYLPDKR